MNPARRAIIADLRHKGLTGKEAYEASKDPEFMKQWVRVVLSDKKLRSSDGKPKIHETTWIEKWIAEKTVKKMKERKIEQESFKIIAHKKSFIAKLIRSGISPKRALAMWEKKTKSK